MTFTIGHVQGGTNAGCRRPLKEPRSGWRCGAGHENRGYATRCLADSCREKRPR